MDLRKLRFALCFFLMQITGAPDISLDSNKMSSKEKQINSTFIITGNKVHETI